MLEQQPKPSHRALSPQRGVSLIELMVGITIGLLVVVAALGTLSFTQVSSTTVNDNVRLQQKATSAFRSIGFQGRQAGSQEIVTHPSGVAVTFSGAWTGVGGSLAAVGGVDGGGPGVPDTLQLSFQDNGITRDCLGNLPIATAGDRVDTTYSVVGGRLQCTDSNGVTQVLIDGVEDFQVTYGAKSYTGSSKPPIYAAVGGPSAPRVAAPSVYREYNTAAAALAQANLPFIPLNLAVTICLQLRGDVQTDAPPVAIQGCSGAVPGDGFVRRVYRNTYGLRATLL